MRKPPSRIQLVVFPETREEEQKIDSEDRDLDDGVSSILGGSGKKGGNADTKGASKELVDYDAEPGNFHLGQYHFSQGGVRYLSTKCKQCQDYVAAVQHAKSKEGSKQRNKSRVSAFVCADSKNLAEKHSTLDVQNCSSTTCTLCCSCGTAGGRGRCRVHSKAHVAFIKPGGATFLCMPVENDEGEGEGTKDIVKSTGTGKHAPRKFKLALWSKKE